MRKIQDCNISLRISKNLKNRFNDFSLQYELHSSSVIRQALLWYLQRQMDEELPRVDTSPTVSDRGGRSTEWLACRGEIEKS